MSRWYANLINFITLEEDPPPENNTTGGEDVMKTLIIYDSYFSNTEKIAQAIGAAVSSLIESREDVVVVKVDKLEQEQLQGIDLLIVGSPTRAFRPTKEINIFLKQMSENQLKGVKVIAFDTRISTDDTDSRILNVFVKLFGYAAKPIADKLNKKGGELILQPEGFLVEASEGPLKEGEIERAKDWVKKGLNQYID